MWVGTTIIVDHDLASPNFIGLLAAIEDLIDLFRTNTVTTGQEQ